MNGDMMMHSIDDVADNHIDAVSHVVGRLFFVSNRTLIGEALFFRAATQMDMRYVFVPADRLIFGEEVLEANCSNSVIVVDMSSMGQLDPETVASLVDSHTGLIALVEVASHSLCEDLLSAGFISVIDMNVSESALALIIRLARSGQTFLPRIRENPHEALSDANRNAGLVRMTLSEALPEMGLQPPSIAEMGVLIELLEGVSNKEIAVRIGKSVATVKMHVLRLCRRYGASNRVQLVLFFQAILRARKGRARGRVA